MKLKHLLKAFLGRLMKIDLGAVNVCEKCECKPRNFKNFIFAPSKFIAFDRMLNEWIVFADNNTYVKLWIMNKTITDLHILTEDLWPRIRYLCVGCIKLEVLKDERHTKLT